MAGDIRRALQSDIRFAELLDINVGVVGTPPLAVPATTDTLIVADQTFTVQRANSRILLTTRGGGQFQMNTPGLAESKAHLDFSGANVVHWLGAQRIMVNNEFANPFTGHGGTWLKSTAGAALTPGSHTIRFYLYCEIAGNYYCRNSSGELLLVTITEFFFR